MTRIKVLIVDDIIFNRLLLKEIVETLGCEISEAVNGKDAIDKINKQDFDLVLMDIEMPVMNGIETTKYIREKLTSPKKDIVIVAITAHDYKSFFKEYQDVGFNELIAKPYTNEKFIDIFNKYTKRL